MIDAIAEIFGDIIAYIYGVVPNFGVAIIILTVLVKLVTFPLNNKQIQSSKKMQLLQPEMKKIQQKYKDNKEKQNQAMSEFMKEHNINPVAGCLPLLVQFPILIGIFRLLRDPQMITDRVGEAFSPYLFPAAELIDLLRVPNVTFDNFLSEISIYYIFPLIAGATTYIYSKMSTPSEGSQKMMLYMMPAMITVFSFSFPVGLVIYWTMNNVFSIGQHKLIVRMDSAREETAVDKRKAEKKADAGEPDSSGNAQAETRAGAKKVKPRGKKGKDKQ